MKRRTTKAKRKPSASPLPTFLTQDEMKRLLAVIKNKRDRAIFLTAYRHGLRATEIGLLARTDVDIKRGRLTVQRVKNSHSSVYPMQPDLVKLETFHRHSPTRRRAPTSRSFKTGSATRISKTRKSTPR